MKKIAIIGAGQLGSRHLQALALHKQALTIYIVDPTEESLNISRDRFIEVDEYKNKELIFSQSIGNLPLVLDFVVIATNSLQRLFVLKELLHTSKVQYLLLEKFLFPKEEEYDEALELIAEKEVKAYVNCARRMWPSYQGIKEEMVHDTNIKLTVTGSNWNLSSNAIHFLDLYFYLTNDKTIILDTDELDDDLIENKRQGYIDFSGALKGHSLTGNQLSLTSTVEGNQILEITIDSNKRTVKINESLQEIHSGNEIMKFPILHVSETTHKVFEQLTKQDTCELVTFERSARDHLLLLEAFNKFLNGREGAIT